jgi:glutathione synthase/RimK-type ligase-like ATP-grasp enzyme/gamma-glutamyl:cysteine ligase YbdK (ATP-grasp superfamily)
MTEISRERQSPPPAEPPLPKRSLTKSNAPPPTRELSRAKRRVVVVAEKPDRLARDLAVDAACYLSGKESTEDPNLTVVNFCKSDRYLSQGYYVSLLADARGQQVIPSIDTLEAISSVPEALRLLEDVGVPTFHGSGQDRRRTLTRLAALNRPQPGPPDVIEELSVFGRVQKREIARIAMRIHRRFPVPVCRLSFVKIEGAWRLFHLEPVPLDRVENGYREQVVSALRAGKLFPQSAMPASAETRASLAVLFDGADPFKPSDQATLDRLERVAARQGLRVQRLGFGDLDRVSEHDALFIRCLTGPDLPAFRFAQRAEALGIPVIDDTRSILRCGNKVYLAELLGRAGVPMPRSSIVQRGTSYASVVAAVGSPFVLKLPDGSFSTAVYKVANEEAWQKHTSDLLASSPMLIAQAWVPTAFDWRVGVLDGRPLYACRYHMVPGHWQIRGSTSTGNARDGRVEGVPLDHTPASVKRVACRAARLIGDGLYGVDVKELETGAVVIEINDNPDVNLDYEDQAEGDRVYEELSAWFLKRIDEDPAPARVPRANGEGDHPDRAPIGKVPHDLDQRDYRAYEVCGLEMEYVLVDRDLEPQHLAEEALSAIAGRSCSDVELGVVGFSNEFFDHLIEMKTHVPLRSLQETEQVLAEGAARLSRHLERFGARAMPTSMHPWLDPSWAQRWSRSGRGVYETYARLFDTATHGWANVQSCQVNFPLGRDHEAVAMMNASALLLPYIPAIAASSPMYGGELRPAVDNRLAFILQHQLRLPETQGPMIPEYTTSLPAYRRDVLKPIFAAVDRLGNADSIRHEWLNARAAVFKFSRRSMEVRVVDAQECVKMDVAISAFIRGALADLSAELIKGKLKLPEHARLVEDFHACVQHGSAARVWAPHVPSQSRGDDGKVGVGNVIQHFILRAERRLRRSEEQYMELISMIRERGTLSERIAARLTPFASEPDQLRDEARNVYLELCDCLADNRVWAGRYVG